MRDNGIPVIVGQREGGKSWDKAVADGFVPGETLFPIEEAARRASVIQFLLSDAGQVDALAARQRMPGRRGCIVFLPRIRRLSTANRPVSFRPPLWMSSWPPPRVRAPRCAPISWTVPGINSSYAVFQDYTGRAKERVIALGIAIGSGYLFPTTFEKEVYSDLTGERGVLMGCLAGVMEAQYNLLRKHGHSPSEAFNETVEELTQSLIRLVAQNGMGLDVCELQHHRPTRRAGLGAQIQGRGCSRLQ